MDEPAAGLDTDESLELGRHLRALPEAGVTVLLVDHDMGLVLSVCDKVVVLDFGRVIARGTPDQIRHDDAVVAAYLGSHKEEAAHA
jgi:branched-chain amino acid transport system ATP-binding protein